MKKRIVTGLTPTGDLTLGNYLGALKQMIFLQEEYDSYLFVADLHAITMPQNPVELKERIKKFVAMYIACGIDPNKNTIYIQSENEYIPSISWLLECSTSYGEISRMIQFKEKSKKSVNFSVGLLTYPILMAADILCVDADYVPVGIDQKQHIELAKNTAEKFNNKYGKTFTLPEVYINETGTKIKDLQNPTQKMSKSGENQSGVISMFDKEEDIIKKIMKATTDSGSEIKFDEVNKPGISNLLNIAALISNVTVNELEKRFENKSYAEFKKLVAKITAEHILEIQKKYEEIINSDKLDQILSDGAKKSKTIAEAKYNTMKEKIGLSR